MFHRQKRLALAGKSSLPTPSGGQKMETLILLTMDVLYLKKKKKTETWNPRGRGNLTPK